MEGRPTGASAAGAAHGAAHGPASGVQCAGSHARLRGPQWENSAVKGDVFDAKMSSSFAEFVFDAGNVRAITRWWVEGKEWQSATGT